MKSSKEQEYSADQSSQVINAYQVLLKPLSRATYLLETFGVDVEEEGTVTDPEILMEVMEMQETISSCSDSNKLQALKEKSHSRMLDYQKTFAEAMKRSDLDAAKEAVQRMSYFHRIINTIIQKLSRKLCATFQCNKKKRSSRTKQMLERILEPVVLLQPLLLLDPPLYELSIEGEGAIGVGGVPKETKNKKQPLGLQEVFGFALTWPKSGESISLSEVKKLSSRSNRSVE
ncbi:hypothetical protein SELMODRAFT_406568 [Selaginella moellendorffii]|uniref:Co-chaperone HscB C-terminal oligomerisation domain-containing protein n=1 Tax=Selaginella moellendorffii TaxID=88036 RepID=D8R2T7_SELML|nr:hypothetical protein SELMODRAFT_406568 [Selaginella moellendorffii]